LLHLQVYILLYRLPLLYAGSTAVAQLVEALRYKPEGRGFIGVIGIFHCHNPSGCTVTLGSTQPLTEMSTRNISWGVKAAGA
jgi:hypothetical protein